MSDKRPITELLFKADSSASIDPAVPETPGNVQSKRGRLKDSEKRTYEGERPLGPEDGQAMERHSVGLPRETEAHN